MSRASMTTRDFLGAAGTGEEFRRKARRILRRLWGNAAVSQAKRLSFASCPHHFTLEHDDARRHQHRDWRAKTVDMSTIKRRWPPGLVSETASVFSTVGDIINSIGGFCVTAWPIAATDMFPVRCTSRFRRSVPLWIPFKQQINEIFTSDRQLLLKLAAGAFVGCFLGISLAYGWADGHHNDTPGVVSAAIVGGSIALAVGLVVILNLKDAVCNRIASGKRANVFLRLLLTSGSLSLIIWVVFAFVASIGLAIALS